jgi:hypothetical protein
MVDPEQQLETELKRFQAWVLVYPTPKEERSPEWERDYADWPALYAAFTAFAAAVPCQDWSQSTTQQLVFALAHDTDQQGLIGELARHPATLLCLAERVSAMQVPDAAWQIVAALGRLDRSWPQAESLLLRFTQDEDEYVRRRALLALAESGSPHAADPEVTERIWHSGGDWDVYGRMAVLYALWKLDAPQLEDYLTRADEDGRQRLVDYAARVRAGAP